MQTENLSEKSPLPPSPQEKSEPTFSLDDIPEPPKFEAKKNKGILGLFGKKDRKTESKVSREPMQFSKGTGVKTDEPVASIPPPPLSGAGAAQISAVAEDRIPMPPKISAVPKPAYIPPPPMPPKDNLFGSESRLSEPPEIANTNIENIKAPSQEFEKITLPDPEQEALAILELPGKKDFREPGIPKPPKKPIDLEVKGTLPEPKRISVLEPADQPEEPTPMSGDEDAELQELLSKMKQEAPMVEADVPEVLLPLTSVNGVGEKRKADLEKAGIDSIDKLADHDHRELAKKVKMPVSHAKKIVAHAKVLRKRHAKKSPAIKTEEQSIAQLIKELEKEKGELASLKKSKSLAIKGIPDAKGHEEIISLLEELEKKKLELIDYENNLKDHEAKLDGHKDKYLRDYEYLENLKRRVDHDIRERTQYLIDLEKDFYKKGQEIAKRQSVLGIKEEQLKKEVEQLSRDEIRLRKMENELHDREVTLKSKERHITSVTTELKRKEEILSIKEQKLDKQEEHYDMRLAAVEKHEKAARKELEAREKDLEEKLKHLKGRERELEKKQKVIDIEDRALDYAESEIESEREKLEEDEFQQYLHEKIGMIKQTNVEIQDLVKSQKIHVPDLEGPTGSSIHDHIDSCRRLLEQGRVTEAKIFYNKARDKFYDINFKTYEDKEDMHNVLRKLYDDINLKAL